MAENRNQHDSWDRDQQGTKPESGSKPGKRAYEERDRAGRIDKFHQDNARGDRNPATFAKTRNAHRKLGVRAASANGHAW